MGEILASVIQSRTGLESDSGGTPQRFGVCSELPAEGSKPRLQTRRDARIEIEDTRGNGRQS